MGDTARQFPIPRRRQESAPQLSYGLDLYRVDISGGEFVPGTAVGDALPHLHSRLAVDDGSAVSCLLA